MDKIFIRVVRNCVRLGALLFAVVLLSSPTVFAYGAQEYVTTSKWPEGTLVSLSNSAELNKASRSQADYAGVVTKQASEGRVEVANEGVVRMLVLEEADRITSGDKLGLSQVSGISAKWYSGAMIAVAQETPTNWQSVTLENGNRVRVGLIKVQLLDSKDSGSGSVSNVFFSTIERTASGVAGRPVDTWRVLTAMFIAIGGLILSFGLLFISSRESFFSIGRNPMASKMIMHGLWKIVALSVLILCTTLAAAYLIVRIQ